MCATGTPLSWTNCAQSMQVWWKSWQTATASCNRRNTRGSHWRSTISRMCPSWRYINPDAQCLSSFCCSFLQPRLKKVLNPEIPVHGHICVIREMVGDYNGVLGKGVWKAVIVLALEAEKFECFVYCIRGIFPIDAQILSCHLFLKKQLNSIASLVTDLWTFIHFLTCILYGMYRLWYTSISFKDNRKIIPFKKGTLPLQAQLQDAKRRWEELQNFLHTVNAEREKIQASNQGDSK